MTKPVLGILDLEVGNIASVAKAAENVGAVAVRIDGPHGIPQLSGVILPGVGSFGAAVASLDERRLRRALLDWVTDGVPLLGICLGMQLLLDCSEEAPSAEGLGLIPGTVISLPKQGPRIGWSEVVARDFGGVPRVSAWETATNGFFYFNHNFSARPADVSDVLFVTADDAQVPALIERNNVTGVQFHPERSQLAGRGFLRSWLIERVNGAGA